MRHAGVTNNASTGKTALLIDMTAFSMAGLDDPLFHAMLNWFVNWTHNQPVARVTADLSRAAKLCAGLERSGF